LNTLTSAPVAPLLEQLFADSDTTKLHPAGQVGLMMMEELQKVIHKTDPRTLCVRARDTHLAISRETGKLLYMLARIVKAQSIVEFGTSFGVSTIHLAAALKDNGGGRLIGTEYDPSKVLQAREHIARVGLADFVEVREGDALQTLLHDLPETVDLLFLDGTKQLYVDVLWLVETRLRAGAIIIADNASGGPEYLRHVRSSGAYHSVAFGNIEVSILLDTNDTLSKSQEDWLDGVSLQDAGWLQRISQ
jgi:predicted O-methyltransferase YrrM